MTFTDRGLAIFHRILDSSDDWPGPDIAQPSWLHNSVAQIVAIAGERDLIYAAHDVAKVYDANANTYEGQVVAVTSDLLIRSIIRRGPVMTEAFPLSTITGVEVTRVSNFVGTAGDWPHRLHFTATFPESAISFPIKATPADAHWKSVMPTLQACVKHLEKH